MRFIPVNNLKCGEKIAANISNLNMQILIKKGTVVTEKTIRHIKNAGIQSVYVMDEKIENLLEEIVDDIIKPEIRSFSVNKIKKQFDRFQKRVNQQKKSLKYGDSGQDLFQGIKDVSSDLINEIMLAKNTRVMMNDIKTNSDYQYKHSVNIAVLSLIIGTELGLSTSDLENLAFGALMCDMGMQWIDSDIILKQDPLNNEDKKSIQSHVEKGYNYVNENTIFNAHVKSIIMHHHERIDGKGYPKGLTADEIHPLAKIVMIADVYDALTSDRPYRPAHKQHEAIEYIMANADSHFDFKIANLFSRKIVPYPVGTYVLLSTNEKAVIIKNTPQHPLRPTLQLFSDEENTSTMDLLDHNNIVIKKIIYDLEQP